MKPLSLTFAIVTLALAPAASHAQQAFTLDQVMSAPFPEGLVAAPAGGSVAWVFNDRGARNIWVAAARLSRSSCHQLPRRRRTRDHRPALDAGRESHRLRARRRQEWPWR